MIGEEYVRLNDKTYSEIDANPDTYMQESFETHHFRLSNGTPVTFIRSSSTETSFNELPKDQRKRIKDEYRRLMKAAEQQALQAKQNPLRK